jgi:hypothetical protein
MLRTLTTGLKKVKFVHYNLEFKACVYALVLSLYHGNAVNSQQGG